ncbi:ribulose-phosphate 3-epimerase [Candidatus Peregrinibacteria bacterium]|nr:ribulose-phosphate 3-epimerase [Candidatus Peregrinibacteria bacterium]
MGVLITPSILSADLVHLQDEVDSIESYADALQVDVMDGHFVPNLSFGAPVLRTLKTKLPLDIHLMVSNPADRIQEFLDVDASIITFHAEAVADTRERKELIQRIRGGTSPGGGGLRRGGPTKAGIAINPDTSVSAIDDVVEDIDLVLVMSVHPGFAGQKFIPAVLEKVKLLRERFPHLMIQMDGGIDTVTAVQCIKAGANNLVAASAIFGVPKGKRGEVIRELRGGL